MMLEDELADIASARGTSLRNIELDYLLDVCLHSVSRFRRALVFKGGTALYKFHGLDRYSEDLDFTLGRRRLDLKSVRDRVVRYCDLLGLGCIQGGFDRYRKEVNFDLRFRGPLYDGRKESLVRVAFNVSLREAPQEAAPMFYSSPYREVAAFELYVMSASEMLAEKVRAVMTRDKPRDVYDLWFLLRKGVSIDGKLVKRKLRSYDLEFDQGALLEEVAKRKGAWRRDLGSLVMGRLPDFQEVMDEISLQLDRYSQDGH
jgi:predicted nucleotidyltransferase component of viral defense system